MEKIKEIKEIIEEAQNIMQNLRWEATQQAENWKKYPFKTRDVDKRIKQLEEKWKLLEDNYTNLLTNQNPDNLPIDWEKQLADKKGINKQLEDINQELTKKEAELSKIKENLENKQGEVNDLPKQVGDLRTEKANLQTIKDKLDNDLQKTKNDLQIEQAKVNTLNNQLIQVQDDKKQVKTNLVQAQNALIIANKQLVKEKNNHQVMQVAKNVLQTEKNQLENDLFKIKNELINEQNQHLATQSSLATVNQKANSSVNELTSLRVELEKAQNERDSRLTQTELDGLKAELNRKIKKVETLETKLKDEKLNFEIVTNEKKSAQSLSEILKDQLDKLQTKNNELSEEKNCLQKTLETEKKANESLTNDLEQVKKETLPIFTKNFRDKLFSPSIGGSLNPRVFESDLNKYYQPKRFRRVLEDLTYEDLEKAEEIVITVMVNESLRKVVELSKRIQENSDSFTLEHEQYTNIRNYEKELINNHKLLKTNREKWAGKQEVMNKIEKNSFYSQELAKIKIETLLAEAQSEVKKLQTILNRYEQQTAHVEVRPVS